MGIVVSLSLLFLKGFAMFDRFTEPARLFVLGVLIAPFILIFILLFLIFSPGKASVTFPSMHRTIECKEIGADSASTPEELGKKLKGDQVSCVVSSKNGPWKIYSGSAH